MAGPAALVFFFAWYVMGAVASGPAVRAKTPSFRDLASQGVPAKARPGEAARIHFGNFLYVLTHVPEVCSTGEPVNELQKEQCRDFWGNLLVAGLVAGIPFGAVMVFGWLAFDSLQFVYRRARRRIEKGKAALSARISERPVVLASDAWGWIHCLRSIEVRVQGQAMKVYIPEAEELPAVGQTLAIIDGGKGFGKPRFFGMVYTPHVAIVRGSN